MVLRVCSQVLQLQHGSRYQWYDYLGCVGFHYGQCLAEGLLCVPTAEVDQSGVSILHHRPQLFAHTGFTISLFLVLRRAHITAGQPFHSMILNGT